MAPFMVSKLDADTGGRTRAANVDLLENNARIAARIARALVG